MFRTLSILTFLTSFFPLVAGDTGDDFVNNLFSDLAPLLALFGERVAQQFLSQSMGLVDNIIFAMAPLGIMTAIVSAIRVGGPTWLKAVIGRAREAYAIPELELLSSTSSDVCELWNGVTLVKVLGSPSIVELMYFSAPVGIEGRGVDLTTSCRRRGRSSARKGFLKMISLCFNARVPQEDVEDLLKSPEIDDSDISDRAHVHPSFIKPSAPNVSLNITKPTSKILLWFVACIGIVLQLGVLSFDAITTYNPIARPYFQKDGYPVAMYAFPATVIGTVLVVAGMLVCASVVESASEEDVLEPSGEYAGRTMRLMWLQRHGKVGDQLFDSYAIFARDARTSVRTSRRREPTRKSIRRGNHETPALSSDLQSITSARTSLKQCSNPGELDILSTVTTFGTIISVIGFVIQFMGLRAMPWTAKIAQLAATAVMAGLRAWIRTTELPRPETCKLPQGYELDWLAMRLEMLQGELFYYLSETEIEREFWGQGPWRWDVVTGRHRPKGFPSWSDLYKSSPLRSMASEVVLSRKRLQKLTKWTREGSMAIPLVKSIEQVMNIIFDSDDVHLKNTQLLRFEWPIFLEYGGVEEPYPLGLSRESTKHPWKVADPTAIEAILSLWRFTLQQNELAFEKEQRAMNGPDLFQQHVDGAKRETTICRLLGPGDTASRRDYELWIYRGTELASFQNNYHAIGFPVNPSSAILAKVDHGSSRVDLHRGSLTPMARAPGVKGDDSCLCVLTTGSYEKICAQDLFSTFMWYAVDNIQSLAGKTSVSKDWLRANPEKWEPPTLQNPFLSTITKALEGTGLGTSEEICMSIVPPLHSSTVLGHMDFMNRGLTTHIFAKIRAFESRQDWEEAGKGWYWLYNYCDEHFQSEPTTFYTAAILLADFSVNVNEASVIHEKRNEYFRDDPATFNTAAASSDVREAPKIHRESMVLGNQGERRKLALSTLSSEALEKVEEGKHGRAIIQFLNAAYKNAGATKVLHENSSATGATEPSERKIEQFIRGLLENEQNVFGWTELHRAITNDPIDAKLPESAVPSLDVKDTDGRTPLHWAILGGKKLWVKRLLDAGCDKNSMDKGGMTPLSLAIMKGQKDIARKLVEEGVNVNLEDPEGWTALYWAILGGFQEGLKMLLKAKANVNIIDSDGRTPLHLAVLTDQLSLVQILLESGANPNLMTDKWTIPLHWALKSNNKPMFGYLLDNGSDINTLNKLGQTLLHWAILEGSQEQVETLLQHGSDPNVIDIEENAPIHLAVEQNRWEIVEMLLAKGANPNALPADGVCILYSQAAGGNVERVRLLLKYGADPSLPTPYGWTPLHWAIASGHDQVVELLLGAEASLTARSDTGKTPADMASTPAMKNLLKRLQRS